MNKLSRLLFCLLLLGLTIPALAQQLNFTYQGQLIHNGQPFTGTADLDFELFADEDGSFSLGTNSFPDHPVNNGLFQVQLSFNEPGPSGSSEMRGLPPITMYPPYLRVTVDGQAMAPLQEITAAPFATLSAYSAYALAPWELNGNDLRYMDGKVGIGRTADDHVVIDSGLAQQDSDYGFGTGALRVMMRDSNGQTGLTKLRVMGNGGVAIGNSYNNSGVPVDGLRVHGDTNLESMLQVEGVAQFNGQLQSHNTAFFHSAIVAANFLGGVIMQELPQPFGFTELCRNEQNFVTQCSASSARYKENISDLESATSLVGNLRAVSFRWIESGKDDIGLIAEEVAEIEPRLATYNSDGTVEGVNYRHLTAVLVAAFQEQQAENVTALAARDAEIATLRDELEAQRRDTAERLAALETRLTEGRQLAGSQP